VLDHVSLAVAPQERLVIIGQSGAGKTTILRLPAHRGYTGYKRMFLGSTAERGCSTFAMPSSGCASPPEPLETGPLIFALAPGLN
jgi:ABC-type ATPase with predicted acetyltransferase domain